MYYRRHKLCQHKLSCFFFVSYKIFYFGLLSWFVSFFCGYNDFKNWWEPLPLIKIVLYPKNGTFVVNSLSNLSCFNEFYLIQQCVVFHRSKHLLATIDLYSVYSQKGFIRRLIFFLIQLLWILMLPNYIFTLYR